MERASHRLIVDRGAASELLADEEFRAWAREQRVFISSVMDGLRDERRVVADRVEELGSEPVLFERFGGREDDAEAAYGYEVASSSIYIAILGRRYGRQLVTRFSATHTEYLAAEENGLRVAVWAKDLDDREGHAQSFLDDVRTSTRRESSERRKSSRTMWSDASVGSGRKISRRGVKLGSVVFRARTITEKAGRVDVVAQIRDRGVLAQIEGIRSDRSGARRRGCSRTPDASTRAVLKRSR